MLSHLTLRTTYELDHTGTKFQQEGMFLGLAVEGSTGIYLYE